MESEPVIRIIIGHCERNVRWPLSQPLWNSPDNTYRFEEQWEAELIAFIVLKAALKEWGESSQVVNLFSGRVYYF
jgi:hypothetical protein